MKPLGSGEPAALLISMRDAAKLLNLSEKTVWSMASTGRLPSLKAGRRRLFSVTALEKWVEVQLQAAQSA